MEPPDMPFDAMPRLGARSIKAFKVRLSFSKASGAIKNLEGTEPGYSPIVW